MSLPKPCCLTPFKLPGEPQGELEQVTPKSTVARYHAKPKGGSTRTDTAVVLLYDLFGFSLPNSKILADEFADKLGVDVFVPDYIPDPPPIEPFLPITDLYPHQKALTGLSGLMRLLQTVWAYIQCLPTLLWVLDPWVMPKARNAIKELNAEGYTSIGLIGYCRGGAVAIRLLAEQTKSIKCAVICHPGPIKSNLFAKIELPTTWQLADEDDFMQDKQIAKLVIVAERKRREGLVMDYHLHPETTHGFASRPNEGHEPSKAAFLQVKETTVRFLGDHLVQGDAPS